MEAKLFISRFGGRVNAVQYIDLGSIGGCGFAQFFGQIAGHIGHIIF